MTATFSLSVIFLTALPDASGQKRVTNSVDPGLFMIDGHTHDLVARKGSEPNQGGLRQLRNAGIHGVVLVFPLNPLTAGGLAEHIAHEKEFVLRQAERQGVAVRFLGEFSMEMEGAPPALQVLPALEFFADFLDPDSGILDQLRQMGIRSITLGGKSRLFVRQNDRQLLSPFGGRVIARMNDLDIAPDITHLNEALQLEVIRASLKPVIASHSNLRSVAACPRNLSDAVASELVKKGGLILLTFDRGYLWAGEPKRKQDGITALLTHLEYAVKNFGVEHVGIGSDYGGSGRNAPQELYTAECFKAVAKELVRKRYSPEDVRKILGGNLVQFFSSPEKIGEQK